MDSYGPAIYLAPRQLRCRSWVWEKRAAGLQSERGLLARDATG